MPKPNSAVDALKNLREDMKELDWVVCEPGGHRLLVAKADVLRIVSEWIEFYQEEANA